MDLAGVAGARPSSVRAAASTARPAVDDAATLAGVAAGDASALSDIYDRHSSAVFGLAIHMTRDRGLAEDIVQETFVGLWRHAAEFDPDRASLRAWIMSIAHNGAIDIIRRRRGLTVSLDSEEGVMNALPPSADVWPCVVERHDAVVVRNALATLPENQRRSIELAYFRGMTQQEIAVETGAPLGTVKGRVRLGLVRLRDLLATDFEDEVAAAA